jgi:hypothetical protein
VSDANLPITGLVQRSQVAADVIAALAPVAGLLDHVFYDDVSTNLNGDSLSVWMSLALDGQVGFDLPGGFAIKIGQGDGITPLTLGVRVSPAGVAVTVEQLAVVLAVPPSLLRPAPPQPGAEPPAQVELVLDGVLVFDETRRLRVEGFDSVSLPRCFVGNTSIVISATNVAIDTQRGLVLGEARIELPKDLPQLAPEELLLDNAAVGPSGVSGKLTAVYTPVFDVPTKRFTGRGSGELGGVPFAFASISIELRDNSFVDASLAGQLLLPFFDHPVEVSIALRTDGSFSIDLGGTTPLTTIEQTGLLRLAVEHLGFEVTGGKLIVHSSGMVTLLVGGTAWPSFHAEDISISSDGHIAVHGAGLVLKNGQPLGLGALPAGAGVVQGIAVDKLAISGNPLDDGLVVDAEVSTSGKLGPFSATLQHVGAHARLTVSGSGPVAADLALHPPSGIGLSVDAEGVLSGGGLLFHDEAHQLYAGAMQLSLHERITLKAFGLIATRLPDGSPGYSLIVFITAEDFQPIPLGLGFTLLGIGGMVGVNRTFDEEVLRQGLKSGTLATLLFPRDPVGNASALIQALSSAFPARRGSYLLGLLAKIGWFTPTLVLMDLALILEFGARNRLLALGHISALLPSASNDLVRLNMEAMGVIDFDAGTAAIDAVLLDSRLAHKFAITGAAALRAGFASGPSFVLAVGGLNPHFAPPAGFPTLERVAIALSSGDNPRLLCQAYFAITSNTVQFGAAASLYASAAGFSVQGDVGFDVLVQLLPLHFIADYHAKLQLKYGSHNLFMVTLDGELEGPRPLRISGKASFEIFWCDFSVQFDTTLVRGEPPPLPAAVDVLAQLRQALALPASWHIERSLDHPHGVALRSLAPSSALVLDPLGQLSVTQQTVPLNTGRDVDTFSGAPVAGARRFALTASLNGTTLTSTAQQASFAPAQYFTMSDDEKLAAPAFEAMDAGCTFGSAATQLDVAQSVAAPLTYRTIVIGETPASTDYVLNGAQLRGLSRSGAAARAPLRRVGRVRFANTAAAPAASLLAPRWTIAPNGDGAPRAPDPALRSWSDYHAAVITLNRASAIWQLLPSHELEP